VPVSVSEPLAKRITQWDEYSGRFEAVAQVEVRARVSGFIDKVHFRDGQLVNVGDLLFTIDQRPYQLAVDNARAEVARARAQVELSDVQVTRGASLIASRTITDQDFDQRKANASISRAQLQSAESGLKVAELNFEWTEVRAPLAGRISDRRVDPGNLVAGGQTGATLLSTIVSIDPIRFVFDVSEADYLRYTRLVTTGVLKSSQDGANPVRVKLADETEWTRTGQTDFIDNALNPRSGTVRGRAVVPNKDGLLRPGLFGRLQLYGGEYDAKLVPDKAIISDQARKIVFVVGADGTVVAKPVTLGPISEGLRVIRDGLASNDRVVLDGLANPMVRPGAKVTAQKGEIVAEKR
jgi:multidrug efflux system membrane fusion protein